MKLHSIQITCRIIADNPLRGGRIAGMRAIWCHGCLLRVGLSSVRPYYLKPGIHVPLSYCSVLMYAPGRIRSVRWLQSTSLRDIAQRRSRMSAFGFFCPQRSVDDETWLTDLGPFVINSTNSSLAPTCSVEVRRSAQLCRNQKKCR